MKTFKCRDMGMDCDWEIQAQSENEILQKAEDHGMKSHGLRELTPEMRERVKNQIHDIKAA